MKEVSLKRLRAYNVVVGLILLVQGIAMYLLSQDIRLPLTTSYIDPSKFLPETLANGSFPVSQLTLVGDLQVSLLLVTFLVLSGLFLLGSATVWRKTYESQITRGMNLFRWAEYSVTSSLMVVVIAMLCGIYDIPSLVLIFALNATMILFGWMMELHNQTTSKVDWTSYLFGCFAGIVPWIAMGMYFFGAAANSNDSIPTFVYIIFVSLFIAFNVFSVNMILQYAKVGKWRDYLYGEYAYITFSLVAKALLAWQVWAGILR